MSTTRWYPILLLRNALGRFIALRAPQATKPRHRSRRRPVVAALQLALF